MSYYRKDDTEREKNDRKSDYRSSAGQSYYQRQNHDSDRHERAYERQPRSKSRDRKESDRNAEREPPKQRRSRSRSREKDSKPNFKERKQRRNNQTVVEERRWGKDEEYADEAEVEKEPEQRPDFGLSGALAKDERTGNVVNGIVLKFTEPYEAAMPEKKNWRLYMYKENELVETLHIHRRSSFLIGRDSRVADIIVLHPSTSLQHAVIQYRGIDVKVVVDGDRIVKKVVKPYLMDLQSTHGTFLNGSRIEDSRYYELREMDLIKFGSSTREYVLMHDKIGTSDDADE